MRIRDPIAEADEPFNLVPLTDMVFNLLIFFMAATTFAQVEKEIGIKLPRATAAAASTAGPKQVIININKQGKAVIARKEYDPRQLYDYMAPAVRANPQLIVAVRADREATVDHFAAVMDTCKRAGVTDFKLNYVPGGTVP
ncbi:MAG TPA: biopolymer transporter ExbD [Humisphaera sp.]